MEFTQKQFYQVGMYSFIVVAICMIANFLIFYEVNNIFSKISQIATIIFNFALVLFFRKLLDDVVRSEEMIKLMQAQINENTDVKDIVTNLKKSKKEVHKQ